jgi:hypothetical protein
MDFDPRGGFRLLTRSAGALPAFLSAAIRTAACASAFAAVGLALATPVARAQAPAAPATVRAGRATAPVHLDGIPDEAAWLTADSITEFTQREPREGAPSSHRTVVRVLAAPEGVFFAFWCYDQNPSGIVRTQLRRDADLDSDDHVAFVLDPQGDRRSGYYFAVNANGAMADGEVQGFENVNGDWNGVWDARARVGSDGWTAEVFIPFQTLRYRRDDGSWGFNVGRYLRAENEDIVWRGWRRQQGLLFLDEEGHLEGLGELPARHLTEWRPYVSTAARDYQRDYAPDGSYEVTEDRALDARIGFDGKLAVAPTLTLDLTANTDFAQVEADQQMVNLSRFPLFFPEKRPFFLEAGGLFAFGQEEQAMAFYSRRVGLGSGRAPIPIDFGLRLTGRVGPERVGLLAVRTGGEEDAVDLVARVQHDVLSRGYVGGILTGQGGPGVSGRRLTAGLDYQLPFVVGGQNLIFAGYAMGTRDGGGAPTRTAGRFFVDYPNDWSDSFLGISWVQSGFDPALGFVRQDGVWRHTGRFEWNPRPRLPGVRQLEFTLLEWEVSNYIGGGLNYAAYNMTPLGVEFESGDDLFIELSRELDVPQESFDVWERETASGASVVTIPAGRYAWNRAMVGFESSEGRPAGVEFGVSVGQFYTGTSTQLEGGIDFRLAPHIIAGWNTEVEWVRLPQGNFTARTMQFRFDYAFTPRLSTMFWAQWDNESDRLTLNARIHWIPKPGSDAYLVWDSGWPTGLERGGIPWRRPSRGALVGKFVYYFRA